MNRNMQAKTVDILALTDLSEGQVWEEWVTLTEDLLQGFIALSGDRALAHVDPGHAKAMGLEDRIVHGFLVAMPYSRIMGMHLPGSGTVIHSFELKMPAPSYVGDRLLYRVQVTRIIPALKSVLLTLSATNQHSTVVSQGKANCVFREIGSND